MWTFEKILHRWSFFDFLGIFGYVLLIKHDLVIVLLSWFAKLFHFKRLGGNKTLGCLSELRLLLLLVFRPRHILIEINSSLARIDFYNWVLHWDLSLGHLIIRVVVLEISLIESICLRLHQLILHWGCGWFNHHRLAEFILVLPYQNVLRLDRGQIFLTVVNAASSYCLCLDALLVPRQIIQRWVDLFHSDVIRAWGYSAPLV
jgi:hypothetical protein